MVSRLARDDWEDLRAQGLSPTLEDFDRLNQLALRLTDGAETTCANFPRIGWAGDIPFFQPTIQAIVWYYESAKRLAANEDTEMTFWAFALAHAREPHFFDRLVARESIDEAVNAWVASLPVTREEVVRACRYAVEGFDDADAAEDDSAPLHRADKAAAARNLDELEKRLVEACASLKCNVSDLMCEPLSRINSMCAAAAIELGRKMSRDEARLRADYDLTFREIRRRLKEADNTVDESTDDGKD